MSNFLQTPMSSAAPERAVKQRRCWGLCLIALVVLALSMRAPVFLPVGGLRGSLPQGQNSQAAAVAAILAASDSLPASAADDVAASPFLPVVGVLVVLGGVLALLTADGSTEQVNDKDVVEKYFNGEGFERWNKIYGETDDVNPVQKDIRVGHGETVDKIIGWIGGTVEGKTVCDAGCGTGNLSIPLASRGALVSGSDISNAMATEAAKRAEMVLKDVPGVKKMPDFATSDLEKLSGEYDTVCCVDVLIHYPPEKLDGMVGHLASMSKERLVLSFAPKTWYYTLLKRIGELFPGKSKTTRAYLHAEDVVEAALNKAGFEVSRREMTSTSFYFSRLLEARPKASA